MGFGPFLSREEKARINAAQQSNYGSKPSAPTGNLGVGVGPFVSPAQRAQINTSLQQNYGMPYGPGGAPDGSGRGQAQQGVRSGTQEAKTKAINESVGRWWQGLQTPAVGGAGAMMTGQDPTKISVKPPSYGEGAQNLRAGRSPDRNPPASTKKETPTKNPERPSQATGGQETSALTGGRGDTRTNGNNITQTGTNTSPKPMTMDDANKLLSGGYKVEDPYAGTQLPYTQSSPYAGKSNSQIYNPETLHQHQSGPGSPDYVKLSKDIYGDQSGVESYTRSGEMNKDYEQMNVNPGEKVPEEKVNWANRTMADNSDEKVRRRSAMLGKAVDEDGNPIGIMQRMRNQEAIQGRMYAGGKHWQRNKNAGQEGENDFVEISAGQARARSNYTKTADEVFANHLGKAKDTVASQDIPDLPKDTPAPLPDAVPGNTPMDKSPFDTEELMQQKPGKSIIGDNTPYTSTPKGTLFNR